MVTRRKIEVFILLNLENKRKIPLQVKKKKKIQHFLTETRVWPCEKREAGSNADSGWQGVCLVAVLLPLLCSAQSSASKRREQPGSLHSASASTDVHTGRLTPCRPGGVWLGVQAWGAVARCAFLHPGLPAGCAWATRSCCTEWLYGCVFTLAHPSLTHTQTTADSLPSVHIHSNQTCLRWRVPPRGCQPTPTAAALSSSQHHTSHAASCCPAWVQVHAAPLSRVHFSHSMHIDTCVHTCMHPSPLPWWALAHSLCSGQSLLWRTLWPDTARTFGLGDVLVDMRPPGLCAGCWGHINELDTALCLRAPRGQARDECCGGKSRIHSTVRRQLPS